MKKIFMFILIMLLSLNLFSITVDEIVDKLLETRVYDTSYTEGAMIIKDRFGLRETTYKSWAQGEDKTLIEFTSVEEAGQKILRIDDDIWLFYPDADELIRIREDGMGGSVMGSDMSYEDMTGGKDLRDKYDIVLLGEETVDGEVCYVLELTSKVRKITYWKQVLYIDKELFISRKSEMFSKSGDLMKEMLIKDVTELDGLYVPTLIHIEDKLKRDTYTEFRTDIIEIDLAIDPDLFSVEELSW